METLATVVFARTPKGAVAIKSNGEEVPRRLRTLLLAIDGRSPVGQYVPFLTAFAPLSEKFVELEQMGFVKRQGVDARGVEAPVPHSDTATRQSGRTPINESDLFALAASPTVEQARHAPNAFERELQALAAQVAVTAAAQPQAPAPDIRQPAQVPEPAKPVADKPVLAELLREMDKFLSQFAGADALPISLMLEQITSLAQLRQELPQYQELVSRYGAASGPHIERLAALLAKAGG